MAIKNLQISYDMIEKLLCLPDGVFVAGCKEIQGGAVDFVIIDANGKIPEKATFDVEKKGWIR